jgi:hypothetical protein
VEIYAAGTGPLIVSLLPGSDVSLSSGEMHFILLSFEWLHSLMLTFKGHQMRW